MATLKLVNNIFSDDIESKDIVAGTSVREMINAYASASDYSSTLVECYDADTGKTFFASIEDSEEAKIHAVVTVNDKDVSLDYVIQEDDYVSLMFLPASKSQGLGALFGGLAGAFMGATIGNMFCPGLGALIGAGIGLVVGAVVGLIVGPYMNPDVSSDNQKKLTAQTKDMVSLPDVRGSQNQSILNNPIPFVIGKHLTTPFIAGSPYNIIKGVYGDTNEIHALYIVGYGPLALTDFKLGERLVAYNRSNPKDQNAGTILSGLLTKERGDVLSIWDSNDINLEILQQNPWSEEIDYGTLYPYARIQQDVKANIIYIKDGSEPTINYKGASLTNGLRTNSIRFTNPYPASASVELDFPSGLYNTWSESLNGNTVQHYQSMPLWIAIQWRPYTENNPESDPDNDTPTTELTYWQTNKATWDNYKAKGTLPSTRPWITFTQISSNEKYFYTNATITSKGSLEYIIKRTHTDNFKSYSLYKYEILFRNSDTKCKLRYDFTTTTTSTHKIKVTYKKSVYLKGTYGLYDTYWDYDTKSKKVTWNTVDTIIQEGSSKTFTDEIVVPVGSNYIEKELSDDFSSISGGLYLDAKAYLFNNDRALTLRKLELCVKIEILGFYVDDVNSAARETVFSHGKTIMDRDEGTGSYNTYNTFAETRSFSVTEKKPIKSKEYTEAERTIDINNHTGNDLGTAAQYNANWINVPAFDISGLGAESIKDSSINEFRVIADVDFEKWARENFTYSTEAEFIEKYKQYFFPVENTIKAVEVRVVRISANYINTTDTTNVTWNGSSYQKGSTTFNDHFTWDTLSSEIFDTKKLDNDELTRKRPLRDDIYKKCCIVALKAKVDNLENLSSTLEKFTCIASAFAPTYDEEVGKWLPEEVNSSIKYYEPNNQTIEEVNGATSVTNSHGEEITEEEFLERRQDGIKAVKQKDGNNYFTQIASYLWDREAVDEYGRQIAAKESSVRIFLENNVASSILLAGLGNHLGIHALSYDDFDLQSLGELFTFCKSVKDGSRYSTTGTHYNHDGEVVSHTAGDEVETYYTANAYIYQTIKMETLFAKLAIAGRSVYTRKGMNKLTFIIDKPEDYPVGLINQNNTLSSSSVISYKELPAGITVSFSDENDGYITNTVDIFRDGETEDDYRGSLEQYGIDYVTNPYQLYSLGRYVLANRILNKEILYRRVGAEGSNFSLGSVVAVSDSQIMIGTDFGGRITKILQDDDYIYGFIINSTYHYTGSEQGVIINQPLRTGASRVLKIQLKDPISITIDGEEYVLQKGQTNLVLFNRAWAKNTYDTIKIAPEVDDSVSFGLYSEEIAKYRIIGIKATDHFQYDLTLIKYQEDLYNSGTTLPTFQRTSTPQPYSADAFGANTAITRADLENEKIKTEVMVNQAITLSSSKVVLDISPEVQSVPVLDNNINVSEVYIECFCYYMDRLLEQGTEVTFEAKVGDITLSHWTDNKVAVSTSYLTGDSLEVKITATVSDTVAGEEYTRTQIATINRLYGADTGKTYKMLFPYGEKVKVSADRSTKEPSKIKAVKRVNTADGERDTEYGYITTESYPNSAETPYNTYTQINSQDETEYDSNELYFRKFSPILISAGNGKVLGVSENVGAIFFEKEN